MLVRAAVARGTERRRGIASLVRTVTAALSLSRDPRVARARFEEDVRALVRARSITLRSDNAALSPPPANTLCFDVPLCASETAARLEAVFDPARVVDEWACGILDAAVHLAALILEIERAQNRHPVGVPRRPADGAVPFIGSSQAIRAVRERIERVAATDFTILIEGAIDPQPHPNFIVVLCEPAFRRGQREVARVGRTAAKELPRPQQTRGVAPYAAV